MPARDQVGFGDEGIPAQIIFNLFNFFFLRPPAHFVAPETFIVEGRFTQMQRHDSLPGQPLDGFPHDEIGAAQLLKRLVRRPVFVNGPGAQPEINRGGDGLFSKPGSGDKTLVALQNFFC